MRGRVQAPRAVAPVGAGRDTPAAGRRGRYGVAAAVFTAIVVAYFAPVFLRGELVLPSGFLYLSDPVYAESAPAELDPRRLNPILGADRVFQFHPWLVFNVRAIRGGEFPLWNPYSGVGTPHLALDITSVLDPLSTGAGLLLGGERAGTARAVLSVWLAGLGLLALARRRGLSASAGLLAALAFPFGGWFILWLDRPLGSAACWLPWILWGLDRMIHTDRPAVGALAVAAFVALSIFGGHIETTATVLLMAGVFALYESRRVAAERARALRLSAATVAALVAGVALAAVLVVPFGDFLLTDAGGPGMRGGSELTLAERLLAGLAGAAKPIGIYHTLVTAFVPMLSFPGLLPSAFPPPNLAEVTIYIGVLPLLIIGLCLREPRRAGPVLFWGCIALAALGLALRLPALNLINQLPALRWSSTGRFRLIYSFAAAMAAAHALDRLRAQGGIRGRGLLIWAMIPVTGALATMSLFGALGADVPALAGWIAGFLGLVAVSLAPVRWRPAAVVALTCAELVVGLRGVQPTHPAEHVMPSTPATDFLAKQAGARVAGFSFQPRIPPIAGALPLLYDVPALTSYNVLYPKRFRALMAGVNADAPWRVPLSEDWVLLEDPGDPLVDLLGVRYLVTASGAGPELLTASRLPEQFPELAWTDGRVAIWENPDPLPGAFLVPEAVEVGSAAEASGVLRGPGFDFRRIAVVEGELDGIAGSRSSDRAPGAEVARVEDGLNGFAFRVRSSAPGLLVVTQAYVKGWRAEVDGRTVPVRPADLAFLGIEVPAGEHVVRLRYAPGSFRVGLLVSGATLLGLLALVGAEVRRRRSALGPAVLERAPEPRVAAGGGIG